jgi:hypothetical protein
MEDREKVFGTNNFKTQPDFNKIDIGTYYLVECDKMWRRIYKRRTVENN